MDSRPPPADSQVPREPSGEAPRRSFLRLLGGLLGGTLLAGAAGLAACLRAGDGEQTGAAQAAAEETRVALAALPPGGRLRVRHQGRPVELRRDGERLVARSLVCTHFACEVSWRPAQQVYACPCHEGRFGPDGRVVGGPPSRPLPEVPARIEGSDVVLGG